MSRAAVIIVTLVAYKLILLAIGFWAMRRTADNADFFLGGRRLGPLVAAISASASSSSAWTLLGVSGAAFAWGVSALWLFPATVGGFLLNWTWVAPRLHAASHGDGSLTLTEYLVRDLDGEWLKRVSKLAAFIVLFSFLFYVASQFQAAGDAFANTFGLGRTESILIGGGIVIVYTLLGGFWAVSVTDTVQGLLMALTAVVLPIAALLAVGGPGEFIDGLAAGAGPTTMAPFGEHAGFMALAFVVGTLGIGFGYPGQPHVVNRFMALKSERAVRQARVIAVAWAVTVYAGMLLLGLCGRVLFAELGVSEHVFFESVNGLFPPVIAGVMLAAVLSAIMSTADSQLLVAASAAAYDWRLSHAQKGSLALSRIVVVILSAAAIVTAIYAPQTIFKRVLFAWHAVGSAFGPLLLVMLAGYRVRNGYLLSAMATGFGLTVLLHMFPNTPGDIAERVLPFVIAISIAWLGRETRR